MKGILTSDTHYGYSHNTHRIHEKFLRRIKRDVKEQGVELVIHAGDWSSNRQDQFRRTLAMFRRELGPDVKIAAVRGNHDFWDQKKSGHRFQRKWHYGELMRMHKEWFNDSDIHYLGHSALTIGDVLVVGFDGWYGNTSRATADTNDAERMVSNHEGCPMMVYLSNKAYKDLDNLLQIDTAQYRKVICVTHFPMYWPKNDWAGEAFSANPRYFEPMKEKFDVICTGHSHRAVNRIEDNTRLLNCGSDYDNPKHIIFEV